MKTPFYLYHETRALYWGAHGVATATFSEAKKFASKYAAEQFARENNGAGGVKSLHGQGWIAKSEDWK